MKRWFPLLVTIPFVAGLASSAEAQTGDPKHLGGLFNSSGQRRFAGRRQSVNYAHN